jgi:hypothetical protein
MHFPTLDGLSDIAGVNTLAWRFTDRADELWTQRINRFKDGHSEAIAGAGRALDVSVPQLGGSLGWNPNETAASVALSSADTGLVPSKPLPKIVTNICGKHGLKWMPSLLSKYPHRPLHNCLTQGEREAELAKASYTATGSLAGIKRVLIFDDIATRGDTLTAIARAIKKISPRVEVVGIALGKSERVSYAADRGHTISNDHVPWEKSWNGK